MKESSTEAPGKVRALGFKGDDAQLVTALQQGHPGAAAALFDRYANHLQRVLTRVMGVDQEIPDLLQEVFARALTNIDGIKQGTQLKAWLTSIAVFTARGCIRHRQRRRWLKFSDPQSMPELTATTAGDETVEAMQRTYAVLDQLSPDLRIAFTLRFVDGMELTEVADACDVSLSTIKRRIKKAEDRFTKLAGRDPVLRGWLAGGSRWATE